MAELPTFSRFRFAREGAISGGGKLPQGWSNENLDEIEIMNVDLGPAGPSVMATLTFKETNPAKFVSIVLGDYLPAVNEDVVALRLEAEFLDLVNVEGAYLIVREWVAGGSYVGQATRQIPLDKGAVPAVTARSVGGDSRVMQPILSFKRDDLSAGQVTVRIRRLAFASIHDHPGWLSDGRR